MEVRFECIPLREVLHFLGWRGTRVDDALLGQIREMINLALEQIQPRVCMNRFPLEAGFALKGTAFAPEGRDVCAMLAPCREAVLFAATLGAQSERLLLKIQARDSAQALLMDAVLSAAIEAVCDQTEEELRRSLREEGLFLTDRFSPGYGDMPLEQSRHILDVLHADRQIGLTVSSSGVMIPRKSVSAILGVSDTPVPLRARGCEVCSARDTCALRRKP